MEALADVWYIAHARQEFVFPCRPLVSDQQWIRVKCGGLRTSENCFSDHQPVGRARAALVSLGCYCGPKTDVGLSKENRT